LLQKKSTRNGIVASKKKRGVSTDPELLQRQQTWLGFISIHRSKRLLFVLMKNPGPLRVALLLMRTPYAIILLCLKKQFPVICAGIWRGAINIGGLSIIHVICFGGCCREN